MSNYGPFLSGLDQADLIFTAVKDAPSIIGEVQSLIHPGSGVDPQGAQRQQAFQAAVQAQNAKQALVVQSAQKTAQTKSYVNMALVAGAVLLIAGLSGFFLFESVKLRRQT